MKFRSLPRVLMCLLAASVFFVSFSSEAAAQDARVTLNVKDVRMETVMVAIEEQTRYLFTVEDDVDIDVKVTVNVNNAPLSAALEQMVKGSDVVWTLKDRNILLSKKVVAKARTITGQTLDPAGLPVPGVSVLIRNTRIGTVTDLDGKFSLEIPGENLGGQLEFNSLGYSVVVLPIGQRSVFNVTLTESSLELEGTVVTALGIRRDQKALSYNVQEVSSDLVTGVKDANFINSLSGKVAGVTINASSSGVGGASKVVLRGNKSISQSSNALYVIDGVPMYNFGGGGGTEFDSQGATESIADINPEDIQSISVLTGAAAAALYGSQAANGAVMITTKKGEAGRLKVTFSSNTEFLNPFRLPEFQNRYGTGSKGNRSGSAVYSWGALVPESGRTGYTPMDFFDTGHVYTNSLTLSGGTDKNQTYFSAAAVNSDGIVPNNMYDRYNFTFRNTSWFLNDKLRMDASASYIVQKDRNMINQGVYSNPIVSAYLFPRGEDFNAYRLFERYNPATKLMEQFWSSDLEGGDLRMQNPYWIANRNVRDTDKKRYMLSFSLSYDVFQWLNLSGRVRVDNANSLFAQKLYASSNTTITEGGLNGHYTEARNYETQTYADMIATVNRNFGDDWSLNAVIGASINDIKTDELSYRGPIQENGLPNIFNVMDLDDVKKRAIKAGWREQTQSVFASVEAGWKKMLYVTVTGRNDWASQLAGSSQSSFFYPSVGLSWVPTSLWDIPDPLSYLKVRGSFASVGMPFPRHLTCPTYSYDATNKNWVTKTHYPIGDLYPERTKTYEVGVDATLFKKLSLSASWYWADTYNQTFDPQISVSSGYSTIYLQTGHVRNTGVEASVGYDDTWGNFDWNTNFTFSWNKNEIVELVSDYIHPETGKSITKDRLEIKGLGKAKYILKPGGTLGDLYTTSDLKYNEEGYIEVDKNGNLIIEDDCGDIYLGSVFPKYNLAWRNDLSWKEFRLSILFTGRIGGICYSATQANMDLFGVSEASAAARDAGGVLINGRSRVDAQAWYQAVGSQSGLPQYYTYNATNFRLQELSLAYSFPRKWFKNKAGMTLAFVGRNLWMIYCKAPFDPESVASTGLNYQGIDYFMIPSTRSLGLNVKLEF